MVSRWWLRLGFISPTKPDADGLMLHDHVGDFFLPKACSLEICPDVDQPFISYMRSLLVLSFGRDSCYNIAGLAMMKAVRNVLHCSSEPSERQKVAVAAFALKGD